MSREGRGYITIDTESLRELLRADPPPLVIDLRETVKFNKGHLPGVVSFPMKAGFLDRLFKKARLRSLLGPEISRKIVFY